MFKLLSLITKIMLQFQKINRYVRENLVVYEFRFNSYIDVVARLYLNNDSYYIVVESKSSILATVARYKLLSLKHRALLTNSKQYQRKIVLFLLKHENFLP